MQVSKDYYCLLGYCSAYGRLFANDRSLWTTDRIFVCNRPYVFFNQPDDFKKHLGVCKNLKVVRNRLRERSLSPKGVLANAQGSDN